MSAAAQRGKQLYDTLGCQACHMVNGQGGTTGPDLSNEGAKGRSREWLTAQIRNPKANNPQTVMPAYGQLTDENVADLVEYLQGPSAGQTPGDSEHTLSVGRPTGQTTPSARPTLVAAGGKIWGSRCGVCHNLRPPSEYSDAQWAVAVQHMRVRVPLTGSQQKKILEFLQATN
ncbi:MAG: c-type cytochrome [Solirubrobacterales bacterium]